MLFALLFTGGLVTCIGTGIYTSINDDKFVAKITRDHTRSRRAFLAREKRRLSKVGEVGK